MSLLLDDELDIALITETWFKSQVNNCTAILRENGFSIVHFNREDKGGGGLLLSLGIVLNCIVLNLIALIHLNAF